MAATVHVYPQGKVWTVTKDGKAFRFVNRRKAVDAAKTMGRKARRAQVAVHGKDGRTIKVVTYGMPKVQDPPKKGSLAPNTIAAAVGKLALDRVRRSESPGVHPSEK